MPKIIDVPGHGPTEFPDGMSDDQIVAAIKKNMPAVAGSDPSEGGLPFRPFGIDTGLTMPQGVSRFMAGAGKAFADTGRGIGQLARDGIEAVSPRQQNLASLVRGKPDPSLADKMGFPTRQDIDESKALDAPLMQTGAGRFGNIFGNVAVAAPLAMVPGANTIGGSAVIGSLLGTAQPVGEKDSRALNALMGGVAGAAVPAAMRGFNAASAAVVDPFTQAGRTKIAAQLLNRAAADPAAVSKRLAEARGSTPGFVPTVGQAADDAGVASLERTIRDTYPQGFDGVNKAQRGALVDALRGVAKTPEARAAAVTAREDAVKPLYSTAKGAVVDSDAQIADLLKRPSMAAAKLQAAKIAAERGENFALSTGSPEKVISSGILDAQGAPITATVPGSPGQLGGNALHDLKMGLDDAIGNPNMGGIQGAERTAVLGTKDEYLKWLESKIPAYGQAKSMFADMSKPINQMDIGTELYKRFTPALADQGDLPFKSTAQAYANALRNGDSLASHVTGMKSATLEGIMSPEQMQVLQGVAKDSALKAAAENAGRGVGSDTVQKIAMSNIAAQAGVPNWLANVTKVPGGWVKHVGKVLYGDADEQIRLQLAELLKSPETAAAAMQAASGSKTKLAEILRAAAQSGALAAPASANALEQ